MKKVMIQKGKSPLLKVMMINNHKALGTDLIGLELILKGDSAFLI